MNIIGDIGGQYETLRALLKQMPDDVPVSVGDMVDRGPDSAKVIKFFMEHGKAIRGNHEDFFIDFYRMMTEEEPRKYIEKYPFGNWFDVGGGHTLLSYLKENGINVEDPTKVPVPVLLNALENVPIHHIEWIEQLPLYLEFEGALITHAPVHTKLTLEEACDLKDESLARFNILWNRADFLKVMPGIVQIFGHNSQVGFREYIADGEVMGYCLDSSKQKILTGIHWPSRKIFTQPYIE